MRKFTFNPVTTPNGGTIQTQIPGGSALRFVIMNFSPANLSLQFAQGYTAACVSQDRRLFEMHNVSNGNITWTIDSFVGSIFAGLSLVVVEVYEASERIPEVYPSPVPSIAPPNLQYFTSGLIAAGTGISLSVNIAATQLFYVTRLEYFAGIIAVNEGRTLKIRNGQLIGQTAFDINIPIQQANAGNYELLYDMPSPYQQTTLGTVIVGTVNASVNTPSHQLNIWGYAL